MATITRMSKRPHNTAEQDDIGSKHIKVIHPVKKSNSNSNVLIGNEYVDSYKTIDFSCDILQYLITRNCFKISKDSKKFKLSIADTDNGNGKKIPILYNTRLFNINFPKLIVNIQIKNLFESIDFLSPNPKGKPLNYLEYYSEYLKRSREYYENILINLLKALSLPKPSQKPLLKVCDYDKNIDKILFPQPCYSNYGIDLEQYGNVINKHIYESDFIATNDQYSFIYLYDFIMKKYNSEYQLKYSNGINTKFLNSDGSINEKIVFFEFPNEEVPYTKYVIIGINATANSYCNDKFEDNMPDYNSILEDQIANYEIWLKEYTFQEIKAKLISEDADRIKSPADITFADYILNKKKIAGVDFDYMNKMNMLSPEDEHKLMDYLRKKINKMCENKFNKPNRTLKYLWHILEVTFDPISNQPTKIVQAINSIREVNQNHTKLFIQIQKLCRNEMLKQNGIIPNNDEESIEYKQVFTEIDLSYGFNFKSYYIHPLNYKINHYYHENKIITLEELIECSKLMCDGLYPGMEQFKGIPFYAVVPLEITNYCNILNSVYFIIEKYIKCDSGTELGNTLLTKSGTDLGNTLLTKSGTDLGNTLLTKSGTDLGNTGSNNRPSNASANPSANVSSYNHRNSRKSRTRKNGFSGAKSLSIKKSRMNSASKKNRNNSNNTVLDKSIYIPNGKPNELMSDELVSKLFINDKIKVYSSLITSNGLIFAIFLDMSDKKFYYILMEIDISNLETSTSNLREIIKYYDDNKLDIKIFSCVNMPILTIYLIKDFTPGDKIFTTLGNECIYKIFGNMHDFYIKNNIELPITDSGNHQVASNSSSIPSISSISNFYRYFLLQIINMINSVRNVDEIRSNFFLDKLDNSGDSGKVKAAAARPEAARPEAARPEAAAVVDTSIRKYYRIKKKDGIIQMIPESELDANKELIYYECTSNLDNMGNQLNETISILNPVLKNNNIFITIGKEIVMIMNKFPEDVLKTKYIPPQKRQLEKFFKFTGWIISKDYIRECLKIINSNPVNPLVKIDELLKKNPIFHIASLENYNIEELNSHIEAHKQYIQNFIISKDPYLCKNYSPILTVNPFSDISSSILHFHFQQDIIHTIAQKNMNYKRELLKKEPSQSIFDFQSNSYRVVKLINKIQTNKTNINNYLLNPYVPSIKLSSLLNLL